MRENTLFDIEEVAIASSKSNEWYTPSRYIEAARAVMGSIELDPASCEVANRTVKASRYYTEEDNGLAYEWKAKSLWMNPPFGKTNNKSNIGLFISKLLRAYKSGYIDQATVLVHSKSTDVWFRPLWDYPICFADHHIQFHRPGGEVKDQMFGVCFIYLGPNISSFAETFSQFGPVVLPSGVIRRPAPLPQPSLFDLEVS